MGGCERERETGGRERERARARERERKRQGEREGGRERDEGTKRAKSKRAEPNKIRAIRAHTDLDNKEDSHLQLPEASRECALAAPSTAAKLLLASLLRHRHATCLVHAAFSYEHMQP